MGRFVASIRPVMTPAERHDVVTESKQRGQMLGWEGHVNLLCFRDNQGQNVVELYYRDDIIKGSLQLVFKMVNGNITKTAGYSDEEVEKKVQMRVQREVSDWIAKREEPDMGMADWIEDVAAGETMLGYRDWLELREQEWLQMRGWRRIHQQK